MKAKILYFTLSLILFASCNRKDDLLEIPVILTGEIVDIDEDGATFTALFKNFDPAGVTEFGFILSPSSNLNSIKSLLIKIDQAFENKVYEVTDSIHLDPDVSYFMRPYASYNDVYYYGKTVSFYSLGSKIPELSSVRPGEVLFGDTIEILGQHLGDQPELYTLFLNEEKLTILELTDSTIKTVFPILDPENAYFKTEALSLVYHRGAYTSTLDNAFKIAPPLIKSVSGKEVYTYGKLHISGRGFHRNYTKIYLGDMECTLVTNEISDTALNFLAPKVINDFTDSLIVTMHKLTSSYDTIHVITPKITGIEPKLVYSYETVSLTGSFLDNPILSIWFGTEQATIEQKDENTMQLTVPELACNLSVPLIIKIDALQKESGFTLDLKQTDNIQIKNIYNLNDVKTVVLTADYAPILQNSPEIEIIAEDGSVVPGIEYTSFSYVRDITSQILVRIPKDIDMGEWFDLRVKACPEDEFVLFESAVQFPSPVLDVVPDSCYSFSTISVEGQYFDEQITSNEIFIDGELVTTVKATNPGLLSFSIPAGIKEGTHQLQIATNKLKSNIVNLYIKPKWETSSEIPAILDENMISFFHDGKIYAGGGTSSPDYHLYVYDINSDSWTQEALMPVKTGYCVSDDNFGYVVGQNIYRYDFAGKTWSVLTQLPFTTISPISSVCVDNKIFVFHYEMYKGTLYYYDLDHDIWISYASPTYYGFYYLPYPVVYNPVWNAIHIFNRYDVFDLNVLTQTFISTRKNNLYMENTKHSLNGFYYNYELYFYNGSYFYVYDETTLKCRKILGPEYSGKSYVYVDGDIGYVLCKNRIWKYFLNK